MAMVCFGRAFAALFLAFTAGSARPFDLMVFRADDLAAAPRPVHFFFTAVLAAAFDVAFCLAIGASLNSGWREASMKFSFVGGLGQSRNPPTMRQRSWWARYLYPL